MSDCIEYFWDGQVRYGEVGPDARAKLTAVGSWFQEAASINANLCGFGDVELHRRNVTWVLTRMLLDVAGLPEVGSRVRVRTWPSRADRFYHRGYELRSGDGELLVRASSEWALMDLSSRRMTSMPEDMAGRYPGRTFDVMPFPGRVLPRVREAGPAMPVLVRGDDLDLNGHVNHTRYIGWLLSALDDASAPFTLDVGFRAESFPGDMLQVVRSAGAPSGADGAGRECVLAIVRDGTDVCRAVCRRP